MDVRSPSRSPLLSDSRQDLIACIAEEDLRAADSYANSEQIREFSSMSSAWNCQLLPPEGLTRSGASRQVKGAFAAFLKNQLARCTNEDDTNKLVEICDAKEEVLDGIEGLSDEVEHFEAWQFDILNSLLRCPKGPEGFNFGADSAYGIIAKVEALLAIETNLFKIQDMMGAEHASTELAQIFLRAVEEMVLRLAFSRHGVLADASAFNRWYNGQSENWTLSIPKLRNMMSCYPNREAAEFAKGTARDFVPRLLSDNSGSFDDVRRVIQTVFPQTTYYGAMLASDSAPRRLCDVLAHAVCMSAFLVRHPGESPPACATEVQLNAAIIEQLKDDALSSSSQQMCRLSDNEWIVVASSSGVPQKSNDCLRHVRRIAATTYEYRDLSMGCSDIIALQTIDQNAFCIMNAKHQLEIWRRTPHASSTGDTSWTISKLSHLIGYEPEHLLVLQNGWILTWRSSNREVQFTNFLSLDSHDARSSSGETMKFWRTAEITAVAPFRSGVLITGSNKLVAYCELKNNAWEGKRLLPRLSEVVSSLWVLSDNEIFLKTGPELQLWQCQNGEWTSSQQFFVCDSAPQLLAQTSTQIVFLDLGKTKLLQCGEDKVWRLLDINDAEIVGHQVLNLVNADLPRTFELALENENWDLAAQCWNQRQGAELLCDSEIVCHALTPHSNLAALDCRPDVEIRDSHNRTLLAIALAAGEYELAAHWLKHGGTCDEEDIASIVELGLSDLKRILEQQNRLLCMKPRVAKHPRQLDRSSISRYRPHDERTPLSANAILARKQRWFEGNISGLRGSTRFTVNPERYLELPMFLLDDNSDSCLRKFEITFAHQPGRDYGGVTLEWLGNVTKRLFDPALGLFCKSPHNESLIMPAAQNPDAPDYAHKLKLLRAAGRLLAKALQLGVPLGAVSGQGHSGTVVFADLLLKFLTGKSVGVQDDQQWDPQEHQSIEKLLTLTPEEIEAVGLNFTCSYTDVSGTMREAPLRPDGASIPVTAKNLRLYIALRRDFSIFGRIKSELEAFLSGVFELLDADLLVPFSAEELGRLITGEQRIDCDDWRTHTQVAVERREASGASFETILSAGDRRPSVVQWFWTYVGNLTQSQQQLVLQAVTACSHAPAGGFAQLTKPFKLLVHEREFFAISTCFNTLSLPRRRYKSFENFSTYLSAYLEVNVEGFSMA